MDSTLRDLFDGPKDAVVLTDAELDWTRASLCAAVGAAANALRREGVEQGDRVAILATSGGRTVAAMLGARAIGAVACPIDPKRTDVLARLQCAAVVSEVPIVGHRVLDPRALLSGGGTLDSPVDSPIAWILSTSGTTSRSHQVLLSQSMCEHVTGTVQGLLGYREDDRVLAALPLHHVYGLAQLWLSLRAKAHLLLAPGPLLPGGLVKWATNATVLPGIPRMLRWLVDAKSTPPLRLVTLSGQATIPEDRIAFVRAFPRASFVQTYGLTEGFRVLWLPPEEFVSHPEAAGRPTPGMKAWLDETGELWVEGPNVAAGYFDDPEATELRFPAPGKLRTGDLFKHDGDLFSFVGRRDGVFKSFGEKVVPELVERALLAHPNVLSCLVTPEQVDGELRPVARLIARGAPAATSTLAAYLRARIPAAMVPARFSYEEELPSTPSGKLLRQTGPRDD